MTYRIAVVLLLATLAGCQTAIDPSTGQTQTRLTLPFTQANAEAQQARWENCIQFRSASTCQRTVPGGRPPGTPAADDDGEYPQDYRRDP